MPSSLPPPPLTVLVSGRADGAGQPAPGVSGLALLEAESLAAPLGSFHFSGRLSGGLETLWMRPTDQQGPQHPGGRKSLAGFHWYMSRWQRCTEVRA